MNDAGYLLDLLLLDARKRIASCSEMHPCCQAAAEGFECEWNRVEAWLQEQWEEFSR